MNITNAKTGSFLATNAAPTTKPPAAAPVMNVFLRFAGNLNFAKGVATSMVSKLRQGCGDLDGLGFLLDGNEDDRHGAACRVRLVHWFPWFGELVAWCANTAGTRQTSPDVSSLTRSAD
jgi:hypothetical protein